MDFKALHKHRWHIWLNYGEGQVDVSAASLEDAKKEACAHCLKRKTLVDRRPFDNIVQKIVCID